MSNQADADQAILAAEQAEINAALAREEVARVSNALSHFETNTDLLKECMLDITNSLTLAYDSAHHHNNRDIATLERDRKVSLDHFEGLWSIAHRALRLVDESARRVVRYQHAAALWGNAPSAEDIRGPVPMYTPAEGRVDTAPTTSALMLYDSTLVSFSRALQSLADCVITSCADIHGSDPSNIGAALQDSLRLVDGAYGVAIDVLKELHRHADRGVRRQYDAAVTGNALRYVDARRPFEPYMPNNWRGVAGGGIYVGGMASGVGGSQVEQNGANGDAA